MSNTLSDFRDVSGCIRTDGHHFHFQLRADGQVFKMPVTYAQALEAKTHRGEAPYDMMPVRAQLDSKAQVLKLTRNC